MGGGIWTGVRPVLQGGDTGVPDVWDGVLGAVRRDDLGGGGHPCGVSKADHWESSTASGGWDMRDTGGVGGPMGGGDEVGSQVHW